MYVLPIEKNCLKYLESSESTYIKSQNDRPSPKIPHERFAQIRSFLCEFVKLRVAQLVLKIAHLAILTEPRGHRAYGLLPRPVMDPVTSAEGQNILADVLIIV